MQFQKLSAPSLKDLFVQQMKANILSGELAIGTKLPSEREIASQMQVSRAVINSGFETLSREGFVEIKPRQGVFVSDYVKHGNIDTLIAIMEYNGDKITRQEIKSILELRRALEHLATDEFIKCASSDDLYEIEQLVEKVRQAKNVSEAVEATYCFQHAVAVAGENSIIPLIYTSFKPVTTKLWQRFCNRYGISLLYQNTKELYFALYQKNMEEARECTNRHMDDAISGIHSIYEA